MAIQLGNRLKVAGGYLDEAISVENLSGLLSREPEFYGQSIHMTDAFYGNGETPYPIDFWLVPDSILEYKWEVKTLPALESEDDFESFKSFISDFKQETGYIPLANGTEVLVNGAKYAANLFDDKIEWVDSQTIFDETIVDAVEIAVNEAVNKVTSGASEAFDTLKEIEDWIKNNPGGSITPDTTNLATKEELAAVEAKIPSIEGLATETFVKNAIADAQLSGGTEIDLSGYATKDDIKNLASKDEIVTYTNGDGILIDETNKISVKVAKDTVEKENFIELNENNELELNEITLDAAVISEDIEVNGGAWAEEVETVFDGKIPAGITFEDFLKRMVKKEKYAREISTIRNFEVILSGNAPTLTSNSVDVNEKIVEIGTQVKLSQVIPFSTIATQSISAGAFTYGYKIGENGEYNSSQLYTLGLKPDLIETASTIQVTFTKLSQDLNGTIPVENIYVTDGNNVNEVIAYVNEGYNSITLCQTGDTYSSNSNIVNKDIYVATSLKNYTAENGETNIYELTFPVTSATASNKITYHVTGAKKYYIGGINEYSKDYWTKGNPSDIIRNLELQNWVSGSTIETSYTFKEGTKQQTVAVPSEYTKVMGTDRIGGPVNFEMVAENINFYNQQGYSCKYNVFVAPAYDGLSTKSFINITIEK